jgi:hypothetical protein
MYWACAQVEPRRERLASYCLTLAGYEIYQPLLREQRRRSHGRKIMHATAVPRLSVCVGGSWLVGCAVVAGCGSPHHGWSAASARP